jgi:hypothetical protein
MKMKISLLWISIFVWINIDTSAQTLTSYTYDPNGNRIGKQVKGSSPNPTVSASPEAVTPSQPSTLIATGCTGTVNWLPNPNNIQGNQITVMPNTTTQYTANCIVSGCATNGYGKATVSIIDCPTVAISVTLNANTVRYGSQVILNANGCNIIENGVNVGRVTWSTGAVGSRSFANQYGSSTVYTATCGTPYCANISTAYIIIGGITGCLAGDVMITKQNGSWNDVNTWACNKLPTSNDVVLINHQVTLYGNANSGSFGYAKSIIRGNNGTLTFDNRSTIFIPQN